MGGHTLILCNSICNSGAEVSIMLFWGGVGIGGRVLLVVGRGIVSVLVLVI